MSSRRHWRPAAAARDHNEGFLARMADWSDPTNFQLEALLEALLFAYPTPGDIGLMLTLKLNKKYAHYAPANTGYRVALLEVLVQARGDGWLADLVIAA